MRGCKTARSKGHYSCLEVSKCRNWCVLNKKCKTRLECLPSYINVYPTQKTGKSLQCLLSSNSDLKYHSGITQTKLETYQQHCPLPPPSPPLPLHPLAIHQHKHTQRNVGKRGKPVPLQAWSGPEGSRKLRFPDFMTTAQDGGKVVSLTHRPHLLFTKYTWYSFLLEAESTPGP